MYRLLARLTVVIMVAAVSVTLLAEEKRFALVIGNGAYEGSAALKNPVNDAGDFSAALTRLGWQVTLLTNADRRQMTRSISAIRDLAAQSPGAAVLFYFAGHGMQVNGVNYLLPVNEEFLTLDDVKNDAISLNSFSQAMEEASPGVSLVILDACRDNPFARGKIRSTGGSRGLGVVQNISGNVGSAILFATSPGDVAQDGTGSNGVFTAAMLKYMESTNTIEDLFRRVTAEVRSQTGDAQKPWINISMSSEFHLMADQLRLALAAAEKAAQEKKRVEELMAAVEAAKKAEAEKHAALLRQAEQEKAEAERLLAEANKERSRAEADARQRAEQGMKQAEAARLAAEKSLQEAMAERDRIQRESNQKTNELSSAAAARLLEQSARNADLLKAAEAEKAKADAALAAALKDRERFEQESAKAKAAALQQAESLRLAAEKAMQEALAEKARSEAAQNAKTAELTTALASAKAELDRLNSLVAGSQAAMLSTLELKTLATQSAHPIIQVRQISMGSKEVIDQALQGPLDHNLLIDSKYFLGEGRNIQAGINNLNPGDWLVSARLEGDKENTFYQVVTLQGGKNTLLQLPAIQYSVSHQISLARDRRTVIAPLVQRAKDIKLTNDIIAIASGVGALTVATIAAVNISRTFSGPAFDTYMSLDSPQAIQDWKNAGHGSPGTSDFMAIVFGSFTLSLGTLSLIEAVAPVPDLNLLPELESIDQFLGSHPATAE